MTNSIILTHLGNLLLLLHTLLAFEYINVMGAQWLSGRVLDSRLKGRGFEPQQRHCVVVLEQDTFILAYYWFNPGRPVPV